MTPSESSGALCIRSLEVSDLPSVAALHVQVLNMEFLTRYGPAFLRDYYRAWLEAPAAIAVVAVDGDRDGRILGALLGAIDPAVHVRAMVRRNGVRLGARIVARAVSHPSLARDLITTRGLRYSRGLLRMVAGRLARRASGQPTELPKALAEPLVAELTHVLVRPDAQGRGVGRALVECAASQAAGGGRDEMVLVTPLDQEARSFYEHLGWIPYGEMTSKSGESFIRYRLTLMPPDREAEPEIPGR